MVTQCWFLALAAIVIPVFAWLPGGSKQILSRNGTNLFNRESRCDESLLRERFLPTQYGNGRNKIRGVNLGALFILENWLADDIMSGWGCDARSEFDCVSSLHDQAKANADFQTHWATWVNASDFAMMVSFGLNTVRIPVGYWFYESLVASGEHFPQGGAAYLDQIVSYAKDVGMYVIIDLHGAPGAQATNEDTGQYNVNPGFYDGYNYDRAYSFLTWLTNRIHTNSNYSTVGMIGILNEPERLDSDYSNASSNDKGLQREYYPTAISHMREVETQLGISDVEALHIQMMGTNWGSGNPVEYVESLISIAYDDHVYLAYKTGINQTKEGYLTYSCNDDHGSYSPTLIGEWSLAVNTTLAATDEWDPTIHVDWYRKWWAAQVMAYERRAIGWVFWTWKTTGSLNDPRWDYQKAVRLGIISANFDDAYDMAACAGVINGTGSTGVSSNMTSTSGCDRVSNLLYQMWFPFSFATVLISLT